jgi:hypothetical protein
MKRSLVQIVSSFLVVSLLLTAFGCYGSFNLTTKVYKFNGGLGGKFVNELGFLVMCIIPVYEVAGTIDVIVLNTIEFWTDKNPISVNEGVRTIDFGDGKLVINSADKTYEMKQTINGKEEAVRIECKDGETIARDEVGTVLARSLRNSDGGVLIYDNTGKLVSSLTRAQVESMVASK